MQYKKQLSLENPAGSRKTLLLTLHLSKSLAETTTVTMMYKTRVTTHVTKVGTLCYASFSENTILHDKILFLAAVLQCTSSCRDLEVTESCRVPRCLIAVMVQSGRIRRPRGEEREEEAKKDERDGEGRRGFIEWALNTE